MPLKTFLSRAQILRNLNLCHLGSKVESTSNTIPSNSRGKKNEPDSKTSRKGHMKEISEFLQQNPHLTPYMPFLPSKCLNSRSHKNPEHLYLVCPITAEKIAQLIFKRLQGHDQIIGESSPGFGLISKFLLEKGVPSITLYEVNSGFYEYIQKEFQKELITLCKKDFFSLSRYAYLDKMDKEQRVANLLQGMPKKSWTDDPVMTLIGCISNKQFLVYLANSIILQKDIATYGRTDLFLIMNEYVWKAFTASNKEPFQYRASTILLQLFLEAELIEKFPRKYFLPWQSYKRPRSAACASDPDYLYLGKVTMKKDFPIPPDQFVPFYCFMKALFGLGNSSVIATCDKWVTGSGEQLLLPKLDHDNQLEDMEVFTKFKELSPAQLIAVFRELMAHPNYSDSPFVDISEQEWLRSETVDTEINDYHNQSPMTPI